MVSQDSSVLKLLPTLGLMFTLKRVLLWITNCMVPLTLSRIFRNLPSLLRIFYYLGFQVNMIVSCFSCLTDFIIPGPLLTSPLLPSFFKLVYLGVQFLVFFSSLSSLSHSLSPLPTPAASNVMIPKI